MSLRERHGARESLGIHRSQRYLAALRQQSRRTLDEAPRIARRPPFELREGPAHLRLVLLGSKVPAGSLVDLIGKAGAELDHLPHSKVLSECSVLIAIKAIILARGALLLSTSVIVVERHAAALTYFQLH